MCGFKTRGSTYLIDRRRHLITGGVFGQNIHRYIRLQALIGTSAIIELDDGRLIKTGVIECYI